MPADFRLALLEVCVARRYAANEPIFAAGDPPGGIYGIADGAIAFTVALGPPDSSVLHIGRAVCWTGLGPLLSGQPRRASLVAVAPVRALYAPLGPLRAILEARPSWWQHIAQELLIEFDLLTTAAADAMITSSTQRCAATLLRLAGSRFDTPRSGGIRDVQLTQEALAGMTNLSRSSVSAILGKLAERKLIEIGFRTIRLLDIDTLRTIADDG